MWSIVVTMKSKLFFSAFLLIYLHDCVDSQQRVYGGYQIDITRAPYMVSLAVVLERLPNGQAKVYSCGGTILRKHLILTAGHCKLELS